MNNVTMKSTRKPSVLHKSEVKKTKPNTGQVGVILGTLRT